MKRFYRTVHLDQSAQGWRVLLDARAIKTPAGAAQAVPTRALAQALAAEWADQGDVIDPARFVLRDLADYAIDAITPDPAAARATLAGFAETDTLCYRADADTALAAHQLSLWDPLVIAAETRFGVKFERVAGVIHRAQPDQTLARLRAKLDDFDPFTLAALHVLTSLSASLILGLAALEPAAPLAELWHAANLEELWQADLWGKEPAAEARRARRHADFLTAARFAALVRGDDYPIQSATAFAT